MNDFIYKPKDEKVLYKKLIKYIKRSAVSQNANNGKGNGEQKCTNMDFLNKLTRQNPQMIMEMLRVYLEETPKFIRKMKQGLDEMDWPALERASHSLIPSFTTMGINKKYESMAKQIQAHAEKREEPEKIRELFGHINAICLQAYGELQEELLLLEKS
jgi:HPt (histidine-containing phosphotransfer) domain-containing protein